MGLKQPYFRDQSTNFLPYYSLISLNTTHNKPPLHFLLLPTKLVGVYSGLGGVTLGLIGSIPGIIMLIRARRREKELPFTSQEVRTTPLVRIRKEEERRDMKEDYMLRRGPRLGTPTGD